MRRVVLSGAVMAFACVMPSMAQAAPSLPGECQFAQGLSTCTQVETRERFAASLLWGGASGSDIARDCPTVLTAPPALVAPHGGYYDTTWYDRRTVIVSYRGRKEVGRTESSWTVYDVKRTFTGVCYFP